MKEKKTKAVKSKSKKDKKKVSKKASKKSTDFVDDPAIIVIDDNLEVDEEKELEERRAYLEEARSQDSGDWTKYLSVLVYSTKYERIMFDNN